LLHAYRSTGFRFLLLVLVFLAGLAGLGGLGAVSAAPYAAAPALSALPAGTDPAASFLVEKITVAGNRRAASARIVVEESLLKEGKSYTEDDLRVALRRIKRLPFVVEADFALNKRDEGGAYELVFTVQEMGSLFANVQTERNVGGRDPIASLVPFPQPDVALAGDSLLGLQATVGSTGFVFASVGDSNSFSQAGYTQFGLFGAGSFASLDLAYDPFGHRITPTLTAGVALTANQSLRGSVSRLHSSEGSGPFRLSFEDRSAELDWLYDTTDDPFFPTRGTTIDTDLTYESFEDRSHELDGSAFNLGEHIGTLLLSGHHHLPLGERQSLSFGLTGSTYRYDASASSPELLNGPGPTFGYQGTVDLGYAVDLLQGEQAWRGGKLRLETTASYGTVSIARDLRSSDQVDPVHQLSLRETLTYRSPWALVRLALLYSGKVMH
jgi:hypothetical protein